VECRVENRFMLFFDSFILHSSLCILHSRWQGGRDSNPQPTVLETATVPIELPPYAVVSSCSAAARAFCQSRKLIIYATTSLTRPARIVRPPSRMANRWRFSIATGAVTL